VVIWFVALKRVPYVFDFRKKKGGKDESKKGYLTRFEPGVTHA
jgi:hypothetical protein